MEPVKPGDHDRDPDPEVRARRKPVPAVDVDRDEDRLGEERDALEREGEPEDVAEVRHELRPQQPELEREDRPGDDPDREQDQHHLRPALRERPVGRDRRCAGRDPRRRAPSRERRSRSRPAGCGREGERLHLARLQQVGLIDLAERVRERRQRMRQHWLKPKILRMPDAVRFDEHGLVPCVMQDWRTGEVLTLAYMNADALRLTRDTGEVHFFSRKRGELWRKGETSGNVQRLRQLRYDCDGDAARRPGRAGGARLPHGRALVLLPRPRRQRRPRPRAAAVVGEPEPAAHEALADARRARSPSAGAIARRAPTRSSCSTTRRGSAPRCARRPTRSPAPRSASPTSGSPSRGRRPALSPRGAAGVARGRALGGPGGAQ